MNKITINVDGMVCAHCEKAVKKAVETLKGVAKVSVNLKKKTVDIEYDPAILTQSIIEKSIEDQGYDISK